MTVLSAEYLKARAVRFELPESNPMWPIFIDRIRPDNRPDKWAVRCEGKCLCIDGEWKFEPRPSSRDDAFLAVARFPSLEEAFAAASAAAIATFSVQP